MQDAIFKSCGLFRHEWPAVGLRAPLALDFRLKSIFQKPAPGYGGRPDVISARHILLAAI
jgi:hypothetical protein